MTVTVDELVEWYRQIYPKVHQQDIPQERVNFHKLFMYPFDQSRRNKDAVRLAISSLIGDPPNAFTPDQVATMLEIALRTGQYHLARLVSEGLAESVRVPKPRGGLSTYCSSTVPQTATQAGSLYHRALTVEVRDFIRAELWGDVQHNLCAPLPFGPDIQVTHFDAKLLAVEIETGLKHSWWSGNQSQAEKDNMLRRAIGYCAVLIVVPTLDLKIQIERMIGRRDPRITVMTIRELPSKFSKYHSNLVTEMTKPITVEDSLRFSAEHSSVGAFAAN